MSNRLLSILSVLIGLSLYASSNNGQELDPLEETGPSLTIGSMAPALDIEHWINDHDDTLKPVSEFAKGNVYMVEFWATWCGPCRAEMPNLAKLQIEYKDKGVRIVSISDEDLDTVNAFLDQSADGTDKTYREITNPYSLTTDPDGSAQKDYMLAAGKNGIPFAFLVGKEGMIEWMGHPAIIEEPLAQVVNDKWDRKKFAAELKAEDDINRAMQLGKPDLALELIDKLVASADSPEAQSKYTGLKIQIYMQTGKVDEALKLIDSLIETADSPGTSLRMNHMKLNIYLQTGTKIPVEFYNGLIKSSEKDVKMLDALAWSIYQYARKGHETSDDLINSAAGAAEKALEVDPNFGSAMDTLARFAHLKGDIDKAIEFETKAVSHADGQLKASLSKFLDELKREKKAKEEVDAIEEVGAK